MNKLKQLDNWLTEKVNDKSLSQEERIVYSKVLDYIERNLYD